MVFSSITERMKDEERILQGMEAGVAQIVDAAGDHRGMAILVAPRCAVTCAHVVNMALERDWFSEGAPDSGLAVKLKFPMLPGDDARLGRVASWRSPGFEPNSDVAVLELDDDAPEEAGCAVLGDIRRVTLEGDRLDVFGMEGGKLGVRVELKFMGKPGRAWVQIDGRGDAGFFVKPGFSGGAVWDHSHEVVVGMVVAQRIGKPQESAEASSEKMRIGYMIPAASIIRLAGAIPHERRDQSASFRTRFTLLSVGLFVVMLAHFLAERMSDFPSFLSLGFGSRPLAAFFGMHIGAFLLPALFGLFISYARAHRQHPWWMRLPALGFRAPARSTQSRKSAVLTLSFLVLFPVAAQTHFVKKFFDEGEIFADADKFASVEHARYSPGWTCSVDENGKERKWCGNPKIVGRFDLLDRSKTGLAEQFDDAYRYGELKAWKLRAVTFFPVVQPAIILSLTALTLVWTVRLLVVVTTRVDRGRRLSAHFTQRELAVNENGA